MCNERRIKLDFIIVFFASYSTAIRKFDDQKEGCKSSEELINYYQNRWQGKGHAVCSSIIHTKFEDNSFDIIVVLGALHHLHPQVPEAIDEIYRILKPWGLFFIAEPHQGSVFDLMRRTWYHHDSNFEENEESIDMDQLENQNRQRFDFISKKYYGSIAYPFVFLKIPNKIKPFYSPFLMAIERAVTPLIGKRISFGVLATWEKRITGK